MKRDDLELGHSALASDDLLAPLLQREPASPSHPPMGTVVGRLLALADDGLTPLICFDGQPMPGAMPARCSIDLSAAHIGRDVVLAFDSGDFHRPIVIGVVRGQPGWPLSPKPGIVKVDADGERVTIIASSELTLRCGLAALTLRSDGRIVMRGQEILIDAAAANRICGGSVQLN